MFGFTDLFPEFLRRFWRGRGWTHAFPLLRSVTLTVLGAGLLWFGWKISDPSQFQGIETNGDGTTKTAGILPSLNALDWDRVLPEEGSSTAFPTPHLPLGPLNESSLTEVETQGHRIAPDENDGWQYLGRRLRAKMTSKETPSQPWSGIRIHSTSNEDGGARLLEAAHRSAFGEELTYHFVIGNGTRTSDGEIEVGSRWESQIRSPLSEANTSVIHICLIGSRDSAAQREATTELISFLRARHGHLAVTRGL